MVELNTLDGFTIITEIIDKIEPCRQHLSFYHLTILSELIPKVYEYSFNRIGRHEKIECGLVYYENTNAKFFWALGLMCLEWTLGILDQMSKEGHCYKHIKPCPESVDFHRELYELCKKSFLEVLESHT